MSSAYQSPDDDGVPDLSDPEDLQEFFDRDALKECACGKFILLNNRFLAWICEGTRRS